MKRINSAFVGYCLSILLVGTATYSYSQSQKKNNVKFKKHTLTTDFISEGVAVGDVNKDKKTDIIAGAYWFEAPKWNRHEIFPGKTFNPAKEYSNSFLNLGQDVDQDGWVDLVLIDFPGKIGTWYKNPKNKTGHWQKYIIHDSVEISNESPNFVDVDGDGRLDILCADSKAKQMVWLQAPAKKGSVVWERFPISEKNTPNTQKFSHGLGMGDLNKDGRADVITTEGWWEAPANPKQPNWLFHPAILGERRSHMHAADVNGDGNMDVISASAHDYGICWHEQIKDPQGNVSWKHHEFSKTISQTHASSLTDINKDGKPDLVTGKRFYAHMDTNKDPGVNDPAVLSWFEFTKEKKPLWIEHQIDNNSGAGLNIVTQDITKDGLTDIIVANKKGVFLFERIKK
ncbi:MAG TPA: VCBS repeat-containing protein [Sphingobacteriaceae bacterium]|nr:VCBS repeat-containing protein [Sphingobacteriaceae bacterium]